MRLHLGRLADEVGDDDAQRLRADVGARGPDWHSYGAAERVQTLRAPRKKSTEAIPPGATGLTRTSVAAVGEVGQRARDARLGRRRRLRRRRLRRCALQSTVSGVDAETVWPSESSTTAVSVCSAHGASSGTVSECV